MKNRSAFRTAMMCALAALAIAPAIGMANPGRHAEVAARGADVMPFQLRATTHVFSKTGDGGVQRVVAKDPGDGAQIRLVRAHLRQIADQFGKGDYSGPAHIHGASMPGLAELSQSGTGDVAITYQDLPDGGQIRYSSARAALVSALHRWFDAQLSDHGADAEAGHARHGPGH